MQVVLCREDMFRWLQNAPDDASYKRRLAVWLTATSETGAETIAKTLGVSAQAVWLWLRQYDRFGPAGLERKGRGGRRRGFLTTKEETDLIGVLTKTLQAGHRPGFR